jgi:hypothetical protein
MARLFSFCELNARFLGGTDVRMSGRMTLFGRLGQFANGRLLALQFAKLEVG